MLDAGIFPAPWGRPPSIAIGPSSFEAMGSIFMMGTAGPQSQTWPVANMMLGYPFSVSKPCTAVKLWVVNGSVAAGNFDLGIYDAAGKLLVSKGSTAQAGTTAIQIVDTTDLGLVPGIQYYMGLAMDGVTATTRACNIATAGKYAAMGMVQVASNFPLVTGVTFALMAQAQLPMFGLSRLVTF